MSNINAKNIISENITVTNLNVTYINGQPYNSNPCSNPCKKGYYVPCPDCEYTGPDDCDCGNTCDWCDEEEYIPDECECFVPCNNGGGGTQGPTGPTGPTGSTGPTGPIGPSYASSSINYFFDLVSGADDISQGQGVGFIIDSPTINGSGTTGAFIYPSVRYFSDIGGGLTPWNYTNSTNNTFNTSTSEIFYTMPFNGEITSVSVNVLSWFDASNGQLDIIKASNNVFTRTNINLPSFSSINPTFPITGYTNNIANPSFSAGEGLACILIQEGSVTPWNIPYPGSTGNIDINVYVKFTS